MSFTIQQIRETPTGPRAEVFPSSTYGYVEVIVQAGLAAFINKGTNVFPVSTQWNISPRSIMTFAITPSLIDGGDLQINLSADGTLYGPALTFHLIGQMYNFVSGIELPGFSAQFVLHNPNGVQACTFSGSIILKGV
jgi:hypothetical protein